MNGTPPDPQPKRRPWRELAALALYGLLLFVYRPLDPFEWDEVLFQRALDHYDVASHSPHPPGYPLYVAAGKAVRLVVGDPQLALQLVGIASALAALALTWLLALRLGATRGAATFAAAALAVFPGFLFNANIGMSDVPGVAAGLGVALLFVLAWERPGVLALAALAAGALSGIRVASLIVAMPVAIVAFAAAWRRRSWAWLALAPVAFAIAAAAVWAPAVLVTGPARFLGAVQQQSAYIQKAWIAMRLPGAALSDIFYAWCVRWLGVGAMAALLWVLVVAGAAAWWRSGRRRLVLMAALAAGAFLAFVSFALEYDLAMRYALPAAPFLAILAAGVTALRRRRLRTLARAALVVWIAGTAIWVAPAFPLRLRPAPVWQALEFVRASFDPAKTSIIIDGVMRPHATYVLGRAGFRVDSFKPSSLAVAAGAADPDVVFVTPRPIEGADVLFQADWGSPLMMRLARNRYGECAVCRNRRRPAVAEISPEITTGQDAWQLVGTGSVGLPAGSKPAVVLLEGRTQPVIVRRPGFPPSTLMPGQAMPAILFPGPAEEIRLSAPVGARAEIEPIGVFDVRPGSPVPGLAPAFVVPQVAHTDGAFGSRWRTNVFLYNPNAFAMRITLMFLPTGQANPGALSTEIKLSPGETTEIPDVASLPDLAGNVHAGALILEGASAGDGTPGPAVFVASSRTFNLRATSPGGGPGECLPAVPIGDGLCRGSRATFRDVAGGGQRRVNLGVVALAAAPVQVTVVQRDRSGTARQPAVWELPPFGHLQKALTGRLSDGTVDIEVTGGPAAARVFAYLSQIDRASGAPLHALPEVGAGCPATAPPAPLPSRLRPPTSPSK